MGHTEEEGEEEGVTFAAFALKGLLTLATRTVWVCRAILTVNYSRGHNGDWLLSRC